MKTNRTTLLSVGASILAAGMLVNSTFTSAGQSQQQTSQQQPDSVVAIVADAQGLPFLPPDQRPFFGTFWEVRSSLPCLTAPLPCPPFNPNTPVYAIAGDQYLVDETAGQLISPLVSSYATRTLSTMDSAAILQAQVDELQNFIAKVRERQLQLSVNAQMRALDPSSPPVPGDGSGGDGSGDSSGSGFTPLVYGPDDLWLEISQPTNGIVPLVLHGMQDGIVYGLISKTNLTDSQWNIEHSVPATSNQNWSATSVEVLDRTSSLFLRAQDWTGETNGMSIAWLYDNFGSLQPPDGDYDSDGVNNLTEFQNGTDPNKVRFWLSVANQYVNSSSVPVSLDVVGGVPSAVAILVDSTNYGAATWTAFSSNLTVNVGSTEGWHDIWIGARGRLTTSAQNWQWIRVKLDVTPPPLVFTSPNTATGSQPMIQIQGYSPEPLMSFTYDLANASGLVTNQQVLITGQYISTNVWDFTTNYFQAFDVGLAPGTNLITLRATDLAGNMSTTNINFTLSYAGATNPPTVQLDWPRDGAQISGTNFTWSGFVSDPTASITAQIVNTNAETNSVYGFVERDGTFWVEDLPLSSGTNALTLTVTDAAGNSTVINISIVQSPLTLTMDPVTPDSQLWQSTVNVTGTISDASYSVWVNGVHGTNNGDGTWSATDVPITAGSAAKFHVVAYASGESQP